MKRNKENSCTYDTRKFYVCNNLKAVYDSVVVFRMWGDYRLNPMKTINIENSSLQTMFKAIKYPKCNSIMIIYHNYINNIIIYQRIWCNISEDRRHECLSIYKDIEHTSFKEILDYIKCNMYYCVVLYIDVKYKKFI